MAEIPAGALTAIPIRGIGEIKAGDSLPDILLGALKRYRIRPRRGDILVVTHKIVSKSEGALVKLTEVRPSVTSRRRAQSDGSDARVLELVRRETRRVLRRRGPLQIVETHHGLVCANAGVDLSNVDGGLSAVLLPRDPDASARRLYRELQRRLGFPVPVIITDSFGRPWRLGLMEVAIGAAGMEVLQDWRGRRDAKGYILHATIEAVADELACTAGLVCRKLAGVPACLMRGFKWKPGRGGARRLVRPRKLDLFR